MDKKLINIFEKHGFSVIEEPDNDGITIQQYTPEGEDWNLYFDRWEDVEDYEVDPEYEFTMWVEARQNGIRGVPCIPELWKDQLWKQKAIEKLKKSIFNYKHKEKK